jgi:hypothetical protein
MEPMLSNMRSSPDGCEIADRSTLEAGCLIDSMTYPQVGCNSRSENAYKSKRNWGYMKSWTGPSEFELMT